MKSFILKAKTLNKWSVAFGVAIIIGFGVFALISCKSETKKQGNNAIRFNAVLLQNKQNIVSIAVIGSGPAGMMAGVYGSRAFRDTVVFEGDKPGGLLMDTTDVENWPGETAINGPDIMIKLREQAKNLGTYFLQESVEYVDFTQWPYKLITDNGLEFYALTVIIATGATPRRLGIPGEAENWGSGVSACAVCDAPFFKGLEVMVVGGGDSAVEEAMQLAPYAKKVTIIVRKEAMRAAASMQERLNNYPNISVIYNVELTEVLDNQKGLVTGVKVFNNAKNSTEIMPVDGVFLAIGHDPNTQIFKGKIPMDSFGHINVIDRTQKTEIPGVFAAGDVEDSQYRQAGVAAASGIKAALDADLFLSEISITKQKVSELKDAFYVYNAPVSKRELISITTLKEFEEYTQSGSSSVLLFFFSQTCNASLQMMPIFHEFAQEHEEIVCRIVDCDNGSELTDHFFVNRVPCIIAFKEGTLIGRCNGITTKQQMSALIESFE